MAVTRILSLRETAGVIVSFKWIKSSANASERKRKGSMTLEAVNVSHSRSTTDLLM
jgi:hypothetical protein